ncbi:MAG: HD domain-containing protein, partial [Acidobacteriaceae bacterium]|nr:HD domain-containing protein [Acidobacteriaceae bacterium]
GYGRRELFPCSDVDLLYLLDAHAAERDLKGSLQSIAQQMWDGGIRVSSTVRRLSECERFAEDNPAFTISLLDHRLLLGDTALYDRLAQEAVPKLFERDGRRVTARLIELTRQRHAKCGNTIFHLEPNVKDCPGGLRDANVCAWLAKLQRVDIAEDSEFHQAVEFLRQVRCFLHVRHQRDDNTLDWAAQDAAAGQGVGLSEETPPHADAAYWMRHYFRHARSVERRAKQMMDAAEVRVPAKVFGFHRRIRRQELAAESFHVEHSQIVLDAAPGNEFHDDPAAEPGVVLSMFAAMAQTGAMLSGESERRLSLALPELSNNLEEGPALWHLLQQVLSGRHASTALRAMHQLGILELLIPEFHGIDALVLRDAYHRYTVDEHTFVLIDALYALKDPQTGSAAEWRTRLGMLFGELPHPALLILAALLHDTGKGRSTTDHAQESMKMAANVVARLELDSYESSLVSELVGNHLEMSRALRRDIFDAETVAAFADKVQTPEALRMLTLLTYADIQAVHPDALTPWKAENLWRLYMATMNHLDRCVDETRVHTREEKELVHRVAALLPGRENDVARFLEGFPERYVRTKSVEQMRAHFGLSEQLAEDKVQLDLRHNAVMSELTVLAPDRAGLFAKMTGALAAWGMNIVTADAFSNRQGIVVDSFRFSDTYRTLEMNQSEHEAFLKSIHDVLTGELSMEELLASHRRGRRKAAKIVVETQIEFDDESSSHSTLVEVVAQDAPGLLRALSLAIAEAQCNIEVALIDTEGERAIDVFYLTRDGGKLGQMEQMRLREALQAAVAS